MSFNKINEQGQIEKTVVLYPSMSDCEVLSDAWWKGLQKNCKFWAAKYCATKWYFGTVNVKESIVPVTFIID